MSLETIHNLFLDEIKDLYSAEKQLTKALPKMAKAATSEKLSQGFLDHLEETKNQVARLEQVFEILDVGAKAKLCKAMEGLIEEGSEIIDEDGDDSVKDAALIAAGQKVEHYEIASYGSAKAHAELLGLSKAVELLNETLEEEKATDAKLSELAKSEINLEASEAGADEDVVAPHQRSKKATNSSSRGHRARI